jgi:ribosomal-protein-alanine N-acetyltransferase
MNTAEVNDGVVRLHLVKRPDELPEGLSLADLSSFFHHKMKPYHDTRLDVGKGLDYAFSTAEGKGGFLVLATHGGRLVGGITILRTGMAGYIPENLLLFVAVDPEWRGRGIGESLIRTALSHCDGAMKLHVEPDNPARRLYERVGFATKYLEMRHDNR